MDSKLEIRLVIEPDRVRAYYGTDVCEVTVLDNDCAHAATNAFTTLIGRLYGQATSDAPEIQPSVRS